MFYTVIPVVMKYVLRIESGKIIPNILRNSRGLSSMGCGYSILKITPLYITYTYVERIKNVGSFYYYYYYGFYFIIHFFFFSFQRHFLFIYWLEVEWKNVGISFATPLEAYFFFTTTCTYMQKSKSIIIVIWI